MRFAVRGFLAAVLVGSGVASAAVTITLQEAVTGNSTINVAPGGILSVDVLVTESGEGSGISGIQLDLDAQGPSLGAISLVGPVDSNSVSAALNGAEWESDVSLFGTGLPLVTGSLPAGLYGSGYVASGGKLQGGSRLMTVQMAVDAGAAEGSYELSASGLAFPDFVASTDDIVVSPGGSLNVVVGSAVPVCSRTVVGRHVFYNGSFFGAAVATDKAALLPGQMASRGTVVNTNGQAASSNVISYTRSLNGVYIDVQRSGDCAPLAGAVAASNFEFARLGRALNGAPVAIPAPTSITAAAHPSLANTDRITLVWADNAIPNTNWVRITVRSDADGGTLGLAANDVHYWGVAIGDGMNDAGNNVIVDTADQAGPRPPNNHSTFNRATITDVWDFNKDSVVDTADQAMPRPPNNTTTFNCLVLGVAP